MLTSTTVQIGGLFTRELSVPGDGPVHLLLHGFTDSADTWRPVLSRLEKAGAAGVAIDLPGFGYADSPGFEGHMFTTYDRFVDAAVRHHAERHGSPVVIVGNSLGGCFALRAAMRDLPLAAVAPVAPAGGHIAPWLRALATRLPSNILASRPLRARGLPSALTRRILTVAYMRVAHASRHTVNRRQIRLYLQHQTDGATMLERARIAQALYPEILDPWDPSEISIPAHVIWGRKDRLVMARGARPLAEELPDAAVTVFDEVGHLPQVEAPDQVADILLALADRSMGRHPIGSVG